MALVSLRQAVSTWVLRTRGARCLPGVKGQSVSKAWPLPTRCQRQQPGPRGGYRTVCRPRRLSPGGRITQPEDDCPRLRTLITTRVHRASPWEQSSRPTLPNLSTYLRILGSSRDFLQLPSSTGSRDTPGPRHPASDSGTPPCPPSGAPWGVLVREGD